MVGEAEAQAVGVAGEDSAVGAEDLAGSAAARAEAAERREVGKIRVIAFARKHA